MDIQLLKDTKDGKRLLALLLLIIGIGIFISLFGILLSVLIVGGDVLSRLETMTALANESDIQLMKYFQMVSQFAFFISPALVFAYLMQKHIVSFFKLDQGPGLLMLGLGIVILLLSNPFSEWLIYQNSRVNLPDSMAGIEQWMRESEEAAAFATNVFLDMKDWKDYVINILMIGVLAAVGEELLFRGTLQPLFIRIFGNAHIAIWVTAFLFSAIHIQFYGFFARLFLGGLLGYFFYYSNNLWVPILAHFFNNSIAVTYVYWTKTPLYNLETLHMTGEDSNPIYALLSLSLVLLGIFTFRHYGKKQIHNTSLGSD